MIRLRKNIAFFVVLVWAILRLNSPLLAKAVKIELSIPSSPIPWLITLISVIILLIVIAITLYIIRISMGKEVRVQYATKRKIEESYARKVKAEYKLKSDLLDSKINQVRQRFSMVITKVRNLLSTLNPDELFKSIVEIIEGEIGANRYILFLYDPWKKEIYPFRWAGYSDAIKDKIIIPLSHTHLLTYSILQKQTIFRFKAIQDPAIKRLADRKPISSTIIALPLVSQKNIFGVLHIESFTDGHTELDDSEIRLLSAFPTFIGGAIENANVFVQTRDELTSEKKISQKEIAEKKKLQEIFSRYTSAELVDNLVRNPEKVDLGGSNKEAAILFCDIAGFTNFTSKLTPKEVVTYMNEYLSRMTEVILNYKGEIDKFIGDAIMARFGVLSEVAYPGKSAVDAASAMLKELEKLHADWVTRDIDNFDIRIGIASGTVLAGNIGSSRRQEFTVMGTVVNLASRLEGLNKQYKSHILVDEKTFSQLPKGIRHIQRENVKIRGLDNTITVYEIQEYVPKPKIVSISGRKTKNLSEPTRTLLPTKDKKDVKPKL